MSGCLRRALSFGMVLRGFVLINHELQVLIKEPVAVVTEGNCSDLITSERLLDYIGIFS